MKIAYFTHSLASCWNHGNAHFLRGVLRELQHAGHRVHAYEPAGSWSLNHLLADQGREGLAAFEREYPELRSWSYEAHDDLSRLIDGSDVVIVHEWNEPDLVAELGRLRRDGRFTLLFHDTHHRAVSDPEAMRRFDLSHYDGVLAFGAALADVYRRWGWGDRVFVWHEAADVRLFHPPGQETRREGLIWIGNWGDEERTGEIEAFLLRPAQEIGIPLRIYGVRYPASGLEMLARYGAHYGGWLANAEAPRAFASALATVHVPRRLYARELAGIPTIRVFEALACGIPLVCAPWTDAEGLFTPGEDYLVATDGEEMRRRLDAVVRDADLRQALAGSGLSTILARHTCAHRVRELLAIVDQIAGGAAEAPAEAAA